MYISITYLVNMELRSKIKNLSGGFSILSVEILSSNNQVAYLVGNISQNIMASLAFNLNATVYPKVRLVKQFVM